MDSHQMLLATKLYIPKVRSPLVSRPRLTARLDEGSQGKLVLLCAPGGSGKTVLLSEWHGQLDRRWPLAWVSLGEAENDPVRFWRYLAAALDRIQPGTGERAEALLRAGSIDAVLLDLINAASAVASDFLLALDDYHVIENPVIHRTVAFLLDNLPPQMHLVLSTRVDPPLPLARLRARGELLELRARDLRFTAAEVEAFFNGVKQLGLTVGDVAALEQRTEGWVAGLQMAALSLEPIGGQQADRSRFVAAFTGSHHFVVDYLGEEVLARQSPAVQRFLLDTSVLDRLSGGLCEALTGEKGAEAMLHQLEQANLFVIPLDDQREWYRYHHLFAEVLRTRLRSQAPDREADLHLRASDWFAANGESADAVNHALAAGALAAGALAAGALAAGALAARAMARAADLLAPMVGGLRARGELKTLQGWLQALPDGLVRSRPGLALAGAGLLLEEGQIEAAARLLADAEQALGLAAGAGGLAAGEWAPVQAAGEWAPGQAVGEWASGSLRGEAALLAARIARARGDSALAIRTAQAALACLPDADLGCRGAITFQLAGAYLQAGEVVAAAQTFAQAGALSRQAGDRERVVAALSAQAWIQVNRGRLAEAEGLYAKALELADEAAVPASTAYAHLGLATLHYLRQELAAAAQSVAAAIRCARRFGITEVLMNGQAQLALIEQAGGGRERAVELMRESVALAPPGVPWAGRMVDAYQANLALLQGNVAAAAAWAAQVAGDVATDLMSPLAVEAVALIRLHLAQGDGAAALERLEPLADVAAAAGLYGVRTELLVLKAMALAVAGRTAAAVACMQEAVRLAEPEGYVRPFLDAGPGAAELLRTVPGEFGSALLRLLGAAPAGEQGGLPEPLSPRELEVLRLLAGGATNQAIADQLFLAVTTVKKHLGNIFGKLAVSNRVQAINRAGELHLL